MAFTAGLAVFAAGFAAGFGAAFATFAVFSAAFGAEAGLNGAGSTFGLGVSVATFGAASGFAALGFGAAFRGAGLAFAVGAFTTRLLVKSGVGLFGVGTAIALKGARRAWFMAVPIRSCCSMVLPTICQLATVALIGSINKFIPIFPFLSAETAGLQIRLGPENDVLGSGIWAPLRTNVLMGVDLQQG